MSGTSGESDGSVRALFGGFRGQSEVIGVVLLLGLVMAGIGAVTLVGPALLDSIDTQNRIEAAEQTMREVDAQINDLEGSGENASTAVPVSPGEKGRIYFEDDMSENHYSVSIETTNGSSCAISDQPLGQLTYEHTKSGDIVAYQGGGVWKRTSDGGSVMVSPPDLTYRKPPGEKGTLDIGLANVSGELTGYRRVELSSDPSETYERNRKLRDELRPCWEDLEHVTVTVTSSDFADAWERYMKDEIPGVVTRSGAEVSVEIDRSELVEYTPPKDENATVDVIADDDTVGTDDSEVTIDENGTDARVTLLGAELSGIPGEGCDTRYYYYSGERYEICDVYHGGITMEVLTSDDRYTPWPDGNPNDAPYDRRAINPDYNERIEREDVNDPRERREVRNGLFSYNLTDLSKGDAVTVFARSWDCRRSESRGVTREGTNEQGRDLYFRHHGCEVGRERIEINSQQNTSNLHLLWDGEKVPNFRRAGSEQRSTKEILGDRVNDTGHLQLEPGEVVFLYELSQENAEIENAYDSGDPDYNDAIVLFQALSEEKTVEVQSPDETPPIEISGHHVVID